MNQCILERRDYNLNALCLDVCDFGLAVMVNLNSVVKVVIGKID